MFGWHSTFLSIVPFAAAVTIMIAKFVQENKVQISAQGNTQQSTAKKNQYTSPSIDVKGASVLSITIISFLIALTLVQSGINPEVLPQVAIAFVVSAISLAIFVLIERRVPSPLVDMRLLKDKTLMPSYMIAIATGITMFMAYPAIVQLVRNPAPLGFGGSAVDAAIYTAIHDHVPSFLKCYTTCHKPNRKIKSNHNWCYNQSNRLNRIIDVPFYKTSGLY